MESNPDPEVQAPSQELAVAQNNFRLDNFLLFVASIGLLAVSPASLFVWFFLGFATGDMSVAQFIANNIWAFYYHSPFLTNLIVYFIGMVALSVLPPLIPVYLLRKRQQSGYFKAFVVLFGLAIALNTVLGLFLTI